MRSNPVPTVLDLGVNVSPVGMAENDPSTSPKKQVSCGRSQRARCRFGMPPNDWNYIFSVWNFLPEELILLPNPYKTNTYTILDTRASMTSQYQNRVHATQTQISNIRESPLRAVVQKKLSTTSFAFLALRFVYDTGSWFVIAKILQTRFVQKQGPASQELNSKSKVCRNKRLNV